MTTCFAVDAQLIAIQQQGCMLNVKWTLEHALSYALHATCGFAMKGLQEGIVHESICTTASMLALQQSSSWHAV